MADLYAVKVVDGVVEHAMHAHVEGDGEIALPKGYRAVDEQAWKKAQAGATDNEDGTFTPSDADPILVSKDRFRRELLRREEKVGFEILALRTATAEELAVAAEVRSWQADWLDVPDPFNVKHPALSAVLTAVAPAFIQMGIWANQETATARIAQIQRNEPPA